MKRKKDWKGRRSPGPEYALVYSRTIRLKNGRVLVADHYGLKCFAFWARPR